VARLGPLDFWVKSHLKNDVLLVVHSIKKASYSCLLHLWFHMWLSFNYSWLHVITWLILYLFIARVVG
jgi:hypothetical protein